MHMPRGCFEGALLSPHMQSRLVFNSNHLHILPHFVSPVHFESFMQFLHVVTIFTNSSVNIYVCIYVDVKILPN